MDVAHPIRAVVPTLDGVVLEVLAGTTRSLSRRQVANLAGSGSESGVRLALLRLVRQGVVLADARGNAVYYAGNRNHLAWPAIETLARLRSELRERLSATLAGWEVAPLHASLFGSAARGDGDAESDVDVLLVRPDLDPAATGPWDEQVDRLRAMVLAWAGNQCRPFELTLDRLAEHVAAGDPLMEAWLADGVLLAGSPLSDVVRRTAPDALAR